MKEKNNVNLMPIKSYSNCYIQRKQIYKENKNKSGIYRWNNLVTGKCYIGSAINLTNRLYNYLSYKFLIRETRYNKSLIYKAILKYNYNNFSLDILKYCNSNELIKWEQYYIDLLSPKYNKLKIVKSSIGFKHSPETLLKFKTRKLSTEALNNLRLAKSLKSGHPIIIINKENNCKKKYISIHAAARNLDIDYSTLYYYVNKNKLFRGIYLIIKE